MELFFVNQQIGRAKMFSSNKGLNIISYGRIKLDNNWKGTPTYPVYCIVISSVT